MTVEVKIGADVAAEFAEPDEPLKIKVDVPVVHKIYLKMRRSINGDYMIYDHPLYDIVIMPKKNKFTKELNKFHGLLLHMKNIILSLLNVQFLKAF